MYKQSTILFFSFIVTLAAALPATTPLPHDDPACNLVDHQVRDRCTAHTPPVLNNVKDWTFFIDHPEMCCPAYKAIMCIKDGIEGAEACKKFWPRKKLEFEEDMAKFAAVSCHVEKCKL